MARLAQRIIQLTPSLTLAVTAQAAQLRAAGVDVCGLGAGEPDFDTPDFIKQAAKDALDRGETKYGPVGGHPELRQAIAQMVGRSCTPAQVLVTVGGKQSLYNLMMTLLDPGDEVIIPSPYWVSYPEMVRLAEGRAVLVPTTRATEYKITPAQLQAHITPQTRLVVLNSPGNPTGMVYTHSELTALAQVIVDHDLLVLSDEIYDQLLYDGATFTSISSLGDEIWQRTIISSGFSKSYAMTGWRLGYLVAPPDIIQGAAGLQSHSTSNVATFVQRGGLAALTDPRTPAIVQTMRRAFEERRSLVCDLLDTIPGLAYLRPQGAFYVWIDIASTGLDSTTFCQKLLAQERVACVPGIAFGADDHIRISYATDPQTLQTALGRLGNFMTSLKK
ncbi:pyridoxal phosphate-dependent aminotransferase [Candidatus Cyanaurora vandensis]|uniref:pyridoxal phosphate-dependent aminotransferase n=1 Tax=Candidatus Cyanaurora vandensis TaxID=2714958 RepID=UPI002579E94D|nr:pyridoxal phosphate-dependent aminotransferase [Candidatus Cyanaurora vandensis]